MTCKTSVQLYVSTIIIVNNIIEFILWEGATWKLPSWVVHCYNKVVHVLSVGMAGEALECVCVCVCVKERGRDESSEFVLLRW